MNNKNSNEIEVINSSAGNSLLKENEYFHLYNLDKSDNEILNGVGLDCTNPVYGEFYYLKTLKSKNLTPNDVKSFNLILVGKTISHHESYDVYSLETGKYIYTGQSYISEIGTTNYSVDLKQIFEATGSANFKIVVDEDFGAESFFADETIIRLNGKDVIPKLYSLILETPPKKLIYFEGEEFNKDGLMVSAVYTDDSTEPVIDYSISPLKDLRVGSKYINLSYKGKTIQCPITVLSNFDCEKPTVINSNSNYALVNSARSVKNFSLPNDLSITYNIINKSLAYILDDVSSNNTFLGLNISHVYRPNRKNIGYGNGFSLNICERLIEEGENIYYVDGLGDWYKVEDNIVKSMTYTTSAPTVLEKISLYKQYRDEYTGSDKDILLPVKWLINGGHIKGFNKFGYLVMINDYIGNFYEIKYNSSNKVDEINSNWLYDSLITYKFEYDSQGYLSEIKMPYEGCNPIEFTYDASGNLATVINKGVTLTFDYLNGLISQIQTSDNYVVSVGATEYAEIEIAVKSNITKMPDGVQSTSLSVLSKWVIGIDSVTKIKDIDGNSEIFRVSDNGYVSEYYCETNSVVSYAEKYEVETSPNLKVTVYKADRENLFKVPYSSYSFKTNQLTENAVITYNERNLIVAESANNVKTDDNTYLSYNRVYEYSDVTLLNTKQDTQCTIRNNSQDVVKSARHIVNLSYDSCNKLIKKSSCFYDDVEEKGYDNEEYVYDKNGQVVKVISYNSLSPENAFVSERTYNKYGRLASEKSDAVIPATSYIYSNNKAEPYGIGFPQGYIRQNGWDERFRPTYMDFFNSSELLSDRVNIDYYRDAETKISAGTNTIEYVYNQDRLLSEIRMDGNEYGKISYDIRYANGDLKDEISQTTENAKGEKYTVKADKKQTYIKAYYGETLEMQANYNKYGEITSYSDCLTDDVITFGYNTVGALTEYKCTNGDEEMYSESVCYNICGGISGITQCGIVDITYEYLYGGAMLSDLESITINSDIVINPEYDKLNRYTGRRVKHNGNSILTEKIEYEYNSMSVTVNNESKSIKRASSLPSKFTYKLNNGEEKIISYSYLDTTIVNGKPQTIKIDGNISSITIDGKEITYKYDDGGRLIREDNRLFNYSYLYKYDENGNITSKKQYYYNDITLPVGLYKYTYEDGKLTQINDEAISYDAAGNPLLYRGCRLKWKGRQLISFAGNGKFTAFKYDGLGRRVQKGYIKYYYDSSDRLIKSSDGMEYFYDHTGVAGFKYEDETYFYVKDAQSNIIAILDSTGNIVVEYTYDAWGLNYVTGSNTALGYRNPFRYRSYFYDTETRLYFLKTRYYDPDICRWINADKPTFATIGKKYLDGFNLYAYCFNNPVNYVDTLGLFPIFNEINKRLRYRIDNKGLDSEHLVVQYRGETYQRHKYPQTRLGRHGKDKTEIPQQAIDSLIKAGVPKDYFKKSIIVQLPKWQEGFSYHVLPPFQEGFGGEVLPPFQEGFGGEVLPPHQEGFGGEILPPHQEEFPLLEPNTDTIVAIAVMAVFAIFCIGAAFFTGGQSLWGLVLI